MAQPKVAIRLGTEGKDQIVRDFRDVGDAGDAAANRAARAFEKAANDIESAERRKAAAAAKLVAFSPAGASLSPERGAYPSTADFRAYQQQQALYRQQADALRAAIDPAWAAQQRFNAEMAQARTLISAGAITLDEYCAKLRIEQGALDAVAAAQIRTNTASGAMRAGMQQLGFQAQDFFVQIAGGTSAVRAFAMQAPQAIGALQLMANGAEGGAGRLATFARILSGPVGIGLGVAIPLVSILIEKLFDTDKAAQAAGSGLEDVAKASEGFRDGLLNMDAYIDKTTGKMTGLAGATLRAVYAMRMLDSQREANRALSVEQRGRDAALAFSRENGQDRTPSGRGILGRMGGLFRADADVMAALRAAGATRDGRGSYDNSGVNLYVLEQRISSLAQKRPELRGLADELSKLAAEGINAGKKLAENKDWTDWMRGERATAPGWTPPKEKAARSPRGATGGGESEDDKRQREWNDYLAQVTTDNNRWMNGLSLGKAANDNLDAEAQRLKEVRDFMAEQRADAAAGTALLNVEWQLRGKSREEIEKAVELRRYQMDIERQMPGLTAAQVQELVKAKEAQLEWAEQVARTSAFWDDVRSHGENAVSRLFDITSAESWGKRVKGILLDIANEFIRLQAMKALFGSSGGGGGGGGLLGGIIGAIGGFLGGMGGGGGFGGSSSLAPAGTYNAAIGHEYTPAGAMLVGENGPELVNMPRGARVMTASDTRRAMAASSRSMTYAPVYQIDATGADQAALARVEAKLDSIDRNFASRTLSTVSEADDRLFLRFGSGLG